MLELSNRPGEAPGLYREGRNYQIWVRRWAEVLEDNWQRLHFYREHLDFQPGEVSDLTDLLGNYLPLASPTDEPEVAATA